MRPRMYAILVVGLFLASALGMTLFAAPVIAEDGIKARIDVKPMSCPNGVNLKSQGEIVVAIIDSKYLAAADVDPTTVTFMGASPTKYSWADANGDGKDDIWFHFDKQDLDIDKDTKQVYLYGYTYGGDPFWGADRIKVVGV